MVVEIPPRAKRRLGVVEMHRLEVLRADDPVELVPEVVEGVLCAQVVAGGKGVRRVDAHADAGLVGHGVDDVAEVFEGGAEDRRVAVPGHVFEDGDDGGDGFVRGVEGGGDFEEGGGAGVREGVAWAGGGLVLVFCGEGQEGRGGITGNCIARSLDYGSA